MEFFSPNLSFQGLSRAEFARFLFISVVSFTVLNIEELNWICCIFSTSQECIIVCSSKRVRITTRRDLRAHKLFAPWIAAKHKLSSSPRRYQSYWPFESEDESADLRPPRQNYITAGEYKTPQRKNRASSARVRRERSDLFFDGPIEQHFGSVAHLPASLNHANQQRRRLPRIGKWNLKVNVKFEYK